jgi:uncharacterized protein
MALDKGEDLLAEAMKKVPNRGWIVAAVRDQYPLDQEDGHGRNALSYVAEKGFNTEAQMMLDRGARPDKPDETGTTPLIYAAEGGHLETVQTFIDARVALDVRDSEGRTAAERALSNGFNNVAACLIAAGAEPPPVDLDTELKQPATVFSRPLALRKAPGA